VASSFGPHPSHGWRRPEAITPALPVYYGGTNDKSDELGIPTAAKYLKGIARDWLARVAALGSFVLCEFRGGGRHRNGSALRPSLSRARTLTVSRGSLKHTLRTTALVLPFRLTGTKRKSLPGRRNRGIPTLGGRCSGELA